MVVQQLTEVQRQLAAKLANDLKSDDRTFWNSLSDEERDWFADLMSEMNIDGSSQKLKALYDHDFLRKPPTIAEVLGANYEDPDTGELTNYWLGPDGVPWTKKRGAGLYPYWRDSLLEVCAEDSEVFEWIMCLTGETVIPLLDGTEVPIAALADQYVGSTASFEVYSYDTNTGGMTVGKAHSPRKTGTQQDVFKVTFDDGSSVRANRDHQFVMRNGRKKRLRDLVIGDRMMPFETRLDKRGYEEVYDPATHAYTPTHTLVGAWKYGAFHRVGGKQVLHHKDFDKRNNRPCNLIKLLWSEHLRLHRGTFKKTWAANAALRAQTTASAGDPAGPLQVGLRTFLQSSRGEAHLMRVKKRVSKAANESTSAFRAGHARYLKSDRGKATSGAALTKWNHEHSEITVERASRGRKTRWSKPEAHIEAAERLRIRNASGQAQRANAARVEQVLRRDVTVSKIKGLVADGCNQVGVLQNLKCTHKVIKRVLGEAGLTWKQVATHQNHQVMNIVADGRADVYCMTVEKHHNFAIVTNAPTKSGIMSGNTGPIGGGKTSAAVIGQVYQLIKLSCLRNPHQYHGLMGGGPIVFTVCNVTQSRAKETAYGQMLYIMNTSPYFREHFPVNTRQIFDPGAEGEDKYAIQLPRNVRIALGARSNSAISANVMCAILDEMSFKELKTSRSSSYHDMEAFKLYANVRKRIESRFILEGKKIPSLLCNVSSKLSTAAFLEKHIQAVRHSPKVKINDDSIYVMKPPGTFSTQTFSVMIGDKTTNHRLLKDGEPEPSGFQIEKVPINFLDSFALDLDGAIRDICGIATHGEQPLIRNRDKLRACISTTRLNPFSGLVVAGTEDTHTLEDYLNTRELCQMWGMGYRPKYFPGSARFIHLDLSRTGDCTGMAMGCISEIRHIRRANIDGSYSPLVVPQIWFDFMLKVIPPPNGEIDYSKIRQLILTLRDVYNFPIKKVTADQYQSADMLQLLGKANFEVDVISMDRSDGPYLQARLATMEERIDQPPYEPLTDELVELYHDTTKDKGKVDHRAGSSKDVADAWCGVITSIGLEASPEMLLEPPKDPSILMPVAKQTYLGKSFVTKGQISYENQLSSIKYDN